LENSSNFSELNKANKIWAIGSLHSSLDSFQSIKKYILSNFELGDKLIFLGNLIGFRAESKKIIDEVLKLRFKLMAKYQLKNSDIVFLRGAQEEMFRKLLQLHIAPNPIEILEWIFSHGVDQTIISYNFDPDEFRKTVTQGTIQINKLTTKLNNQISSNSGHQEFFSSLKHAAYTDNMEVLFVNRGVDISRPLSAQNDCFWWGYQNFSKIDKPYFSFKRIVRGYQSNTHNDIENSKTRILCTLFKQPLNNKKILAGIFANNGDILELFESS
jgi:serine/threonine protein phosphatase 1